jgi:hypothetical protein
MINETRLRQTYLKWTTEDELNFLRGLGTWKEPSIQGEYKKPNSMKKAEHLKKYKVFMLSKRRDFGDIIVGEILEYVSEQIQAQG